MPVRQIFAYRKTVDPRSCPKERNGLAQRNGWPCGGLQCVFKMPGLLCPAKLGKKFLARDAAVGFAAGDPRQRSARAHDGIEEPPGGLAIAKFQAIRDERVDAEMVRQWTKNVFQKLANQDEAFTVPDRIDQLLGGLAPQLRLQHIVEVLLTQKIQAIAADSAEQCVQEASRERAAGKISERPRQSHASHARAPRPAFGKALRVLGEKTDRAQGAELKQGPFHTPIRNGGSGSGRRDMARN